MVYSIDRHRFPTEIVFENDRLGHSRAPAPETEQTIRCHYHLFNSI
jgi:hypothetical protein